MRIDPCPRADRTSNTHDARPLDHAVAPIPAPAFAALVLHNREGPDAEEPRGRSLGIPSAPGGEGMLARH